MKSFCVFVGRDNSPNRIHLCATKFIKSTQISSILLKFQSATAQGQSTISIAADKEHIGE